MTLVFQFGHLFINESEITQYFGPHPLLPPMSLVILQTKSSFHISLKPPDSSMCTQMQSTLFECVCDCKQWGRQIVHYKGIYACLVYLIISSKMAAYLGQL